MNIFPGLQELKAYAAEGICRMAPVLQADYHSKVEKADKTGVISCLFVPSIPLLFWKYG